jgi:hypothetical protein
VPVPSDEEGAMPPARRRAGVAAGLLANAMANTLAASGPRELLRSVESSAACSRCSALYCEEKIPSS